MHSTQTLVKIYKNQCFTTCYALRIDKEQDSCLQCCLPGLAVCTSVCIDVWFRQNVFRRVVHMLKLFRFSGFRQKMWRWNTVIIFVLYVEIRNINNYYNYLLCILTSQWVLKIFFTALKQVFCSFSIKNGKKERKEQKITKNMLTLRPNGLD